MPTNEKTFKLPATSNPNTIRSLSEAGEAFLKDGNTGSFIVDCGQIVLLNSLLIGSLVRLNNLYSRQKRQMVLSNVGDEVLEILRSCSLINILKIRKPGDDRILDVAHAMVKTSLEIDFETYRGVGIFKFKGSMLAPADSDLFINMARMILREGHKMLIDMGDLIYIDSLGIGAIIKVHMEMKDQKGEIRICSAGDILKDLLKTQHLDTIIPLYETRDQALNGWL